MVCHRYRVGPAGRQKKAYSRSTVDVQLAYSFQSKLMFLLMLIHLYNISTGTGIVPVIPVRTRETIDGYNITVSTSVQLHTDTVYKYKI